MQQSVVRYRLTLAKHSRTNTRDKAVVRLRQRSWGNLQGPHNSLWEMCDCKSAPSNQSVGFVLRPQDALTSVCSRPINGFCDRHLKSLLLELNNLFKVENKILQGVYNILQFRRRNSSWRGLSVASTFHRCGFYPFKDRPGWHDSYTILRSRPRDILCLLLLLLSSSWVIVSLSTTVCTLGVNRVCV
ncbi:hypothetical protein PV327_005264 [Microctonus hyperodae]|uniref:Uncharacterized protein n=1 Tax=Microctonus hyperodae TaxID=165561 RepID=A0AA39G101_MICHY|nr:hypothetical protein PV327_005264 [Microctonus hyperodae]